MRYEEQTYEVIRESIGFFRETASEGHYFERADIARGLVWRSIVLVVGVRGLV